MRITRLVAGSVTAALIGITPLAISAPAHADGQTYTPVITANLNVQDAPFEAPYVYGAGFYVSGSVTDPAGLYDANYDADVAYLQVYTWETRGYTYSSRVAAKAHPKVAFTR